MVKCKIEWRSQSWNGNGCQITFNRPTRVCYKSKAFLLRWLENSGTYSTKNLWLCSFFYYRRKWKSFWNSKVVEMQGVIDSFWRIRSSSLIEFSCKEKWVVNTMEKFIQNFYTFEYSRNQSVDTSNSEDEEEDGYQTIVLEPENEECEERGKSQSDKTDSEIDKDLPVPIMID